MLSFRVFSFPPGQGFVPSKATLQYWLYTKKTKRTFGGVVLPGLFETVEYSTQVIAFFAILLLEVTPTAYGVAQGVMWEAVVAAIFLDIFFALVAHYWHDKIIELNNILVITSNQISQVAIKRRIAKYTFYTRFFHTLVVVSAIAKFTLFYITYMSIGAITIAVFVCYMLAAILHIAYTGYFVYTSRFNFKIQSEYSKFINAGGQVFGNNLGSIAQPLLSNGIQFPINSVSAGNHRIAKNLDSEYVLEMNGVLSDAELDQLILNQPVQTQGFIALEGLKRQMSLIGFVAAAPNVVNTPPTIVNTPTANGISSN